MTEHPHVPAAFINNIRDEGTKGEACDWLQKQWDEICALNAEIKRLRAEIKELHSQLEFADMAISRFNNGEELQSVLELNNNLRAELNETSRLAYEWMICHDKLKAGEPYTFPALIIRLDGGKA